MQTSLKNNGFTLIFYTWVLFSGFNRSYILDFYVYVILFDFKVAVMLFYV